MTSPSLSLDEMIARVEAATGGDRELDIRLTLAFNGPGSGINAALLYTEKNVAYLAGLLSDNPHAPDVPAWTSSLDATLALTERVLPGECPEGSGRPLWLPKIERLFNGQWRCVLYRVSDGHKPKEDAPTPTLALLLATLKALRHDR